MCFYHGVVALEVKRTKRKSKANKTKTNGCQKQLRFEPMENEDPRGKKITLVVLRLKYQSIGRTKSVC